MAAFCAKRRTARTALQYVILPSIFFSIILIRLVYLHISELTRHHKNIGNLSRNQLTCLPLSFQFLIHEKYYFVFSVRILCFRIVIFLDQMLPQIRFFSFEYWVELLKGLLYALICMNSQENK